MWAAKEIANAIASIPAADGRKAEAIAPEEAEVLESSYSAGTGSALCGGNRLNLQESS